MSKFKVGDVIHVNEGKSPDYFYNLVIGETLYDYVVVTYFYGIGNNNPYGFDKNVIDSRGELYSPAMRPGPSTFANNKPA